MTDLIQRHGNHLHYSNIKFAWITLAALAGYLAVAALIHFLYLRGKVRRVPTAVYGVAIIAMWIVLVLASPGHYSEHFSLALKRAARVAYAMIPLLVALAWRIPPLNYLGRVQVHKWAGWVITALTTFHGVGFLFKWYVNDSLGKNLSNPVNIAGLVIMLLQWGFVVVLVFNLTTYTPWYWLHNAMVLVLVCLTVLHADPGVKALFAIAVAFVVVQYATHWMGVPVAEVLVLAHPTLSLVVAKIPTPKPMGNAGPGQHIRLASHWYLPLHPYTVASYDLAEVELVVNRTRFDITHALKMRGAYRLEFPQIMGNQALTVCCGGLGISMALSLLHFYPDARVIWCVKLVDDLHVLTKVAVPPPKHQLSVYVTQKSASPPRSGNGSAGDNDDDIDDEQEALMMNDLHEGPVYVEKLALNFGRPQWSQLLTREYTLVVVGCGPPLLVDDVGEVLRQLGLEFIAEPYRM